MCGQVVPPRGGIAMDMRDMTRPMADGDTVELLQLALGG